MEWICIVLGVLCVVWMCVALWYRGKWRDSELISKHYWDMYETSHDNNDALVEKICRMEIRHKGEISHLNIQLENERFNKGIFEQRWKNAEEELMKTRDMLPKRDSKGRYCKK
jgi:rubrerythrin